MPPISKEFREIFIVTPKPKWKCYEIALMLLSCKSIHPLWWMEWDKSDTHEYKYLLSMGIHFTRNMLWSAIRDKNRSCTATRLSRSRYRDSRLANAYSNRVTRTRVLKTRLQIALRELAFGKRVSKSRYGNSRLENASSDRVTGTRVCQTLGKRVYWK